MKVTVKAASFSLVSSAGKTDFLLELLREAAFPAQHLGEGSVTRRDPLCQTLDLILTFNLTGLVFPPL